MSSATQSSDRAGTGLIAGIAVVSAATLAVQVLQTRLFSVMLWHHLTYMVVTVTLLGFAAGGTLLAVFPGIGRAGGSPRAAVSTCCSLFGLTLVAAFAILGASGLDTLDIERDRAKYFFLFLNYAYLVVPFLFAGLAIAIALQQYAASVHRTYFWNLIGSGVGPFIFLMAIRPMGGLGSLLLCASLGGVAGLLAAPMRGEPGRAGTRLLALLALIIWPLGTLAPGLADAAIPITPARSKAQTVSEALFDWQYERLGEAVKDYPEKDPSLRKTIWSPTCRLDTLQVPPNEEAAKKDLDDPKSTPRGQVHVFQDGDAPTVIWSGSHAAEHKYDAHFYGLGYNLVDEPRVLIIGPGGGNDVETALHYGAQSVTAVDINGDTLAMLQAEPFKSYTDDIYNRPGVRAVHSEGRSFIRREGSQYDLLQMSGTDTYAALSSGSYIFSESYLYTEEAFDDFFAHMSEKGVISIIRFRFEPPRETLKLVATGARALGRLGVEDPQRHFMVVNFEDRFPPFLGEEIRKQEKDEAWRERLVAVFEHVKEPLRYSATLMRRTPFTQEDVATIEAALEPMNSDFVGLELYYGAGTVGQDTEYGQLLAAMAQGEEAEADFYASYAEPDEAAGRAVGYEVEPATDDKPFFFNFHSFSDVEFGGGAEVGYEALTGSEPIGLYILVALIVQTAIATVLLVIVPLFRLGWGASAGGSKGRILVYFLALGLAYLLVEICTIQRFVLYLGHPTYSLSAGLASFLVFSGLGSATAGALGMGQRGASVAAGIVVVLLILHSLVLPGALESTLGMSESARVLITVASLAPLAFVMGMPFPTGLRLLRQEAPGMIPWVFGVNGAASVLASILSIVIAMQAGFATVLVVAAALYLIAALAVPKNS